MSRASTTWLPILVAAGAVALIAALGATLTQLSPWYYGLEQPSWKPSDALFGPAWTAIFLLAGLSAVIGWRVLPLERDRAGMIGLFALNGFFNLLWSFLFFRLQRPDFALYEVPFLWLSIFFLIALLARRSKLAALLLAPYLLWVSFAAVLNYEVVRLNGPFS
ncbi:MAG: TspO/MBR family protein [Pseudomonadota bacterium]